MLKNFGRTPMPPILTQPKSPSSYAVVNWLVSGKHMADLGRIKKDGGAGALGADRVYRGGLR